MSSLFVPYLLKPGLYCSALFLRGFVVSADLRKSLRFSANNFNNDCADKRNNSWLVKFPRRDPLFADPRMAPVFRGARRLYMGFLLYMFFFF